MKSSNVAKVFSCLVMSLFVLSGFAYGDTHWNVQAVDEDGYGTHHDLETTNKVTVEGIVLNRPDFMLDATPDQNAPSIKAMPKWQIYIQGEGDDHAGTAVWMGQCYDLVPGGDGTYTNQEWLDEIYRLSHDPCTGYEFAPGDRVRVTGLLKSYKGKTNINERHSTNPNNDITIQLIEPAVGLPQPEVIDLNDIKDTNELNFDEYLPFDPNRGCDSNGVRDFNVPATGEYYQARLVRINDVNFADPNWGPDETGTIQDDTGRTFPVKYGRGPGFSQPNNLADQFDVIGIFDQESWDPTSDYRIWVLNYDGNGKVLTDRAYGKYNLPGEINRDGKVDFVDFASLADNWLECVPGSGGCGGSID